MSLPIPSYATPYKNFSLKSNHFFFFFGWMLSKEKERKEILFFDYTYSTYVSLN